MTPEMIMVAICQEMGWDYYQFKRQPKPFIALLLDKMEIDSERIEKQLKKSQRKLRR